MYRNEEWREGGREKERERALISHDSTGDGAIEPVMHSGATVQLLRSIT